MEECCLYQWVICLRNMFCRPSAKPIFSVFRWVIFEFLVPVEYKWFVHWRRITKWIRRETRNKMFIFQYFVWFDLKQCRRSRFLSNKIAIYQRKISPAKRELSHQQPSMVVSLLLSPFIRLYALHNSHVNALIRQRSRYFWIISCILK